MDSGSSPAPRGLHLPLYYLSLPSPLLLPLPSQELPLCSKSDRPLQDSDARKCCPIVGDLLDYLNESWTQFRATGGMKLNTRSTHTNHGPEYESIVDCLAQEYMGEGAFEHAIR